MSQSRAKLKNSEIAKKLKHATEWTLNAKYTEISRTFDVTSFVHGLALAARIAVHAEVMNHHPVLELSYGKVKVKLTTHDAKGLTNADFELAKKIDALKTL
jgi:4a-hydroxytetrahydrobiopterin dehydratase